MSGDVAAPAIRCCFPSIWHPFSPSPLGRIDTLHCLICAPRPILETSFHWYFITALLPSNRTHQIIIYLSGSPTHLLHNPSWWANGGCSKLVASYLAPFLLSNWELSAFQVSSRWIQELWPHQLWRLYWSWTKVFQMCWRKEQASNSSLQKRFGNM